MSDEHYEVRVEGTLTDEGAECQAMRSTEGKLYSLIGDIAGYFAGDEVWVEGTIAETSFCMQGTTIQVERIGRIGATNATLGKMNEALAVQVELALSRGPDTEIPVIITMTDVAGLAELQRLGFKVQYVMESIGAVSGTVTAAEVPALAESDTVRLMEYDGQAHTQR